MHARRPPEATVAALSHVVAATEADAPRAVALADAWGLEAAGREAWRAGAGGDVVVWCAPEGLGLRGPAALGAGPVRPTAPVVRPGRDPLLRAVGGAAQVLDATAGWGVDATTLAAVGRNVVMVERHPVMAEILRDAVARWHAAGHPIAARLTLVEGDAREVAPPGRPDAILLDPMYPTTGLGRARKAEGLHLLRALVGDDLDQDGLLAWARGHARRRVVVKRPRLAPPLAGPRPAGALVGRTVRYDLYPIEEAAP